MIETNLAIFECMYGFLLSVARFLTPGTQSPYIPAFVVHV